MPVIYQKSHIIITIIMIFYYTTLAKVTGH